MILLCSHHQLRLLARNVHPCRATIANGRAGADVDPSLLPCFSSFFLFCAVLLICPQSGLALVTLPNRERLHSTEHYMHVLILHRRRRKMIVVEDALRLLTTTAPPPSLYGVLYCTSILIRRGKVFSSFLLLLFLDSSILFGRLAPFGKKGIINYGVHSESMRVTASSPIYRTN